MAKRKKKVQLKTFKPIYPPVSIEAYYRRRLQKEIRAMEKSVVYWLRAKWKQNESLIRDSATDNLLKEMHKLLRQWHRNFSELAEVLPYEFVSKIRGYTARNLIEQTKPLKEAGLGFNLEFKYMSRQERQDFAAIVAENVNLIKKIEAETLSEVEGHVLRGIQNGFDLDTLTDTLHEQFGVSERRAAMIARDQTSKATNNLTRDRLKSYGVTKAIWMHTSAGKTYRDSHVEMDGEEYDIVQGCWDPDYGDYIQPAQLVNCHCVCRPVIPTVDEDELEDL